ncbi:radical SAM protein, partial [candidate division KSB3 bacterium]
MAQHTHRIVFGPVPSRRLGRSLGINHIPPKNCTYSCVYCQLGRSSNMNIDRAVFYSSNDIAQEVEQKIEEVTTKGEQIDYLTFVSDGEPTLDVNLGKTIELLKPFGKQIAVITNSSLLWREDVRQDLLQADWVSVKVDAVTPEVWRQIDRPHGRLKLQDIFQGISEFAKTFSGDLVTETMLIHGVNDKPEELEGIARFIVGLSARRSYLSIPTRPPAEHWVKPAEEQVINLAYHQFCEHGIKVEYLIGYEGNAFAFTGNVADDLLSITSVHPMRKDAVQAFLAQAQAGWDIVEQLLCEEKLLEL